MSTTTKWVIGILVAAILGVAIGAVAFHSSGASSAKSYGINNGAAVINYPEWETNGFYAGSQQQFTVNSTGQLTLGTNGSAITTLANGTCTASTTGAFAATTSQAFSCPVTNAVVGENVDINLPNNQGTGAHGGGFVVLGTSVSAGLVQWTEENLTGAATSSYPLATTSVGYTLTQ